MKKSILAFVMAATIFSGSGFAQSSNNMNKPQPTRPPASDHFAWGPAIGAIALLGVVVGVVAGNAASGPNNFSH